MNDESRHRWIEGAVRALEIAFFISLIIIAFFVGMITADMMY